MRKGSNNVGITLIALVVTIVVLLILAGVSLNLVLGNNGIITKAQDAKLMTRAGSAEDEVELWKSDNYIARTSNQATIDKETMLQGLKDKKLVYEEEIDRDNEIITIKKKDGTIVKEINYSDSVEVTNVDSSLQQYYVDNVEYDYGIGLKSKETDEPTTFGGAYVVYEGETINITSLIEELDGANVIYDGSIANYLEDIGVIDFYLDLDGEEINIMLVKNGIYYMGTTVIDGLPS